MSGEEIDILVVGSGIAGCSAALGAARVGADVLVATKATRPENASTHWAQGGIAVTRDDPTSFHADVLTASSNTADADAVDVLVENANDAVEDVLIDTLGVPFDSDGRGVRLRAGGRSLRGANPAHRRQHGSARPRAVPLAPRFPSARDHRGRYRRANARDT